MHCMYARDTVTGQGGWNQNSSGCCLQTDYKDCTLIKPEMKDKTTSLLETAVFLVKRKLTQLYAYNFCSPLLKETENVFSSLFQNVDFRYSHVTNSHERNGKSFPYCLWFIITVFFPKPKLIDLRYPAINSWKNITMPYLCPGNCMEVWELKSCILTYAK